MSDDKPDRFSMSLLTALQAFKYLVFSGAAVLGLHELQPLVHEIAGENTTLSFTGSLTVSVGINIVAGASVIELARQNRRLRRRVRELEGKRGTASPKAENAALPGDGGSSV